MATAAAAFPGTAGGWRAACGARRVRCHRHTVWDRRQEATLPLLPWTSSCQRASWREEGETSLSGQGLNWGNRRTGQIRTSTSKHKPKSGRGWEIEGGELKLEQPQPELKFNDIPSLST